MIMVLGTGSLNLRRRDGNLVILKIMSHLGMIAVMMKVFDESDSGGNAGVGGGIRGPRRCGFSLKVVDKEPGELSSESGSEDAIESESVVKNSEVAKAMDNGAQSPVGKKRMFSPIVWDIDGNELSSVSKHRNSSAVTAFPPPAVPKANSSSPNNNSGGTVHTSLVRESKIQISQSPLPVADAKIVGYSALESPNDLVLSPPEDQVNNQDAGQPEDEDYVLTRHISSSRWASGDSSPGDEGEIFEDMEIPKTKKKLPLSESAHKRSWNNSATPELGEPNREGSEAIKSRSSESDEQAARSRSGSGDDYPGNYSVKDDYMEIDVERDRNDISVRESDTDSESENDSPGTPEPPAPPLRTVNMLQGCKSVDEFQRLNKIDEGTYGVVYRAKDKKTGEIVVLKKVKMEKEREGFPLTSLREINFLLSFNHPSIADVKEVVVGSSNLDNIFMVMEYMEHDLKALMETMKQPFSQSEVKCLMLQLLEGVKAPELLLGAGQYSTAIDMWSLGCIMAELLPKEALFSGKTEFDQLDKIFRTLGTPNETMWPGFSKLPGARSILSTISIIYCVKSFQLHHSLVHLFSPMLDLTC
ncbi:Kinase superfamily protein isoform 3 [Hibiscus syriacus]|uniref:Kinase superfamily protein isoform 3 n=1 Tax=Hibiscus syriacus TaxID=106335 RepID=A0A6A2ZNW3_HIBSY|nr:Kinase superfamily protein isoform 3 [Hibiscus syriacus]